jgi:hypothetical protein
MLQGSLAPHFPNNQNGVNGQAEGGRRVSKYEFIFDSS